MNRKRLSDLVRVLRGVPRKLFWMGAWGYEDGRCGTVMCAAGHYMAAFPRRDLKPESADDHTPVCGLTSGTEALAEHFRIPYDDADELFLPDNVTCWKSPKQVARRFEKYMKTGEVPA